MILPWWGRFVSDYLNGILMSGRSSSIIWNQISTFQKLCGVNAKECSHPRSYWCMIKTSRILKEPFYLRVRLIWSSSSIIRGKMFRFVCEFILVSSGYRVRPISSELERISICDDHAIYIGFMVSWFLLLENLVKEWRMYTSLYR